MSRRLSLTALVVRDYDEALEFFVGRAGFDLVEDTDLGGGKRWVGVSPGAGSGGLLLAKASCAEQAARVGDQTGGRVFLYAETEAFARYDGRMTAVGVPFVEAPRDERYATVAVFEDLYGNRWDLIEPRR